MTMIIFSTVEHILATTFATRCLVWDLRKNQTIIKLSDSSSKVSKLQSPYVKVAMKFIDLKFPRF